MAHPYKGQATQSDKDARRAERVAGASPKSDGMAAPKNEYLPQFREDQHGPGYTNDASGWVRGEGETAENKPGFDRRQATKVIPDFKG